MILDPKKYTWSKASGVQAREDSIPKAILGTFLAGGGAIAGAVSGIYYGATMALATNAAASAGIFSTIAMGTLGVAGGLIAGVGAGVAGGIAAYMGIAGAYKLTRLAWNTGVKLTCGIVNTLGKPFEKKASPAPKTKAAQPAQTPQSKLPSKPAQKSFSKAAPKTENDAKSASAPSAQKKNPKPSK